MRRHGKTSRRNVAGRRNCYNGCSRRILATSLCYALFATSLASQRPQPFDQQLRDNQQRLESIRRERSDVEQELERLRTQVHSLSDRSEEHTSELQSPCNLVCRLLLEKKKNTAHTKTALPSV